LGLLKRVGLGGGQRKHRVAESWSRSPATDTVQSLLTVRAAPIHARSGLRFVPRLRLGVSRESVGRKILLRRINNLQAIGQATIFVLR